MFPPFDKLINAEFEQNCRLLAENEFADPESSAECLASLRILATAGEYQAEGYTSESEPGWYDTLQRILLEAPQPDRVLVTIDSFVKKSEESSDAFQLFESSPRSLEVLARLSYGSPFLTETLLDQPNVLRDLITERRTADMKSREDFLHDADAEMEACATTAEKHSALRRFQRREILRIGMCDAFGLLDLKFVTLQLSLLADALVQACLTIACDDLGLKEPPFGVLALGKLGGEELNYSSDIDLILVGDSVSATPQRVARRMIDGLSQKLNTGFLYRVDMRLRPWGAAGSLVTTPETYQQYLQSDAQLWEKQALLKARYIAGDKSAPEKFLSLLPDLLFCATEEEVISDIRQMKQQIEERLRRSGRLHSEVKIGAGSIRDIEFLVQSLQLINGSAEPRVASANTLDALVRLTDFGMIDAGIYRRLREGYIFLRTIEHALQLLQNQQTHDLPENEQQREWLARRLDFPGANNLMQRFDEHQRSVRQIFDERFRRTDSLPLPRKTAQTTLSGAEIQESGLAALVGSDEQFINDVDQMLQDVDSSHAAHVLCRSSDSADASRLITVVAVDAPGMLSLVCAVLFSCRFDIREGDVVTGPGTGDFGHNVPKDRFLAVLLCDFASSGEDASPADSGDEIQRELIRLQKMRESESAAAVQEAVLELFCQRANTLNTEFNPDSDFRTEVTAENDAESTVLRVAADDRSGFLFELANALAISGFRIVKAELDQQQDSTGRSARIKDTIRVTELNGERVCLPERIQELETAVTLILQFSNWLPSTGNPHQALLRFRDLLQSLRQSSQPTESFAELSDPETLRNVGRVLGISRHLWEDFLRVQTERLLPLLTDPQRLQTRVSIANLAAELNELLQVSAESHERQSILNRFKDYNLFRIDLRHVLRHCGAFGAFSQEITELAEVVVSAACDLAQAELSAVHGVPRQTDGTVCSFTIMAMGKFGGVEMGFASDIELLLIYQSECQTDGDEGIPASKYFERLVTRVDELISSRHKGIFEIDLRMRPYGQAGSPAVSLAAFQSYFSLEGDAWPYERQSLVKARCIAGSQAFAAEVEAACHSLVYSNTEFDFDVVRAMREKQISQLVRGGTVNAKLSDGGLVDCEYAVQALQMTFAHQHPTLRSTNTLSALQSACAAELLTKEEAESARQAYVFLRELIDCMRMARGNAQDLTIPDLGTREYDQLANRMMAVHGSELPLNELENQMAAVRIFSKRAEELCRGAKST